MDKSVNIGSWLIGLAIYGGKDPETDLVIPEEQGAFQVGFSREACLNSWAKVGRASLTWPCLKDPKVRRELNNGDSNLGILMHRIQDRKD